MTGEKIEMRETKCNRERERGVQREQARDALHQHMAMSHLFGCMDCPPCPEPFWDMEKSDMEQKWPPKWPREFLEALNG